MDVKRVSAGFGLRVNPESAEGFMENQHLVPQLRSPICADPSVWIAASEVEHLADRVLPDFANPLTLAKSLDVLVDACKKRGISTNGLWPICVTCSEIIVVTLIDRFGPGYFDNRPEERELLARGWKFIGFDVVDLRGLISGLKGCAFAEPSWSRLRNYFGAELNDVGLFADYTAASEFAQARGMLIREHAPFIVVGVLVDRPL